MSIISTSSTAHSPAGKTVRLGSEYILDPDTPARDTGWFRPVFSALIGPDTIIFCSHWSRWFIVLLCQLSYGIRVTFMHGKDLLQMPLCHKEPTKGKKCPSQSPLGALSWFFMA